MSRSIFFKKKKKKKRRSKEGRRSLKRSAGEEGNAFPHARLLFLVCVMVATGGPGWWWWWTRRPPPPPPPLLLLRVAAALDEDAQKRASREILERHAPSQRCGGAALRVWFRLSGGAFIIRVFILITHLSHSSAIIFSDFIARHHGDHHQHHPFASHCLNGAFCCWAPMKEHTHVAPLSLSLSLSLSFCVLIDLLIGHARRCHVSCTRKMRRVFAFTPP